MEGKEELLKELKKQFNLTKKRLEFKSTFKEINNMSYIEDMVLLNKFVSNDFSRQMINRMVETFYSWVGEIYSWIYPAQTDIVHLNESKKISKEERQEFLNLISKILYLVRKNKRIAFEGLKKEEESNFVDELVKFDKEIFNPFMLKFNKRFENLWKEETEAKKN